MNSTSDRLTIAKLKYEFLLKFAKEIKANIEKHKESISARTTSQILPELDRIVGFFRSCQNKMETKLDEKIDDINAELSPYVEEKEELEQKLSDNKVLWREKVIEKSEYKKQKGEIEEEIKICISKIAQVRQKMDDLVASSERKVLKNLQSAQFKESELNKLWRVVHTTNDKFQPLDNDSFAEGKGFIKKLGECKEDVEHKKDKLNRLEKVKMELSEEKFKKQYDVLNADLIASQKECQGVETEIKKKIRFIEKSKKENNQILSDLNTELIDAQIIKKNKIPLKNYLVSKFTSLPKEIKDCEKELKKLDQLLVIYNHE